ncbi:MAG: MFS transporter [Firmicutes bacterium]|nr:MFS transporter [Dethiobacter sp.]MBS3887988.1 MFS transporter [Bacillota bacterium]
MNEQPAVPVLRNKTFLILWGGQVVSLLGDTLFNLALMWWVVSVTESAVAVSFVALATSLPMLILGPFVGVYIDRSDKRLMMLAAHTLNGLITAVMALLYWRGIFSLPIILVAAVLMGIVSNLDGPAYEASIPVVVDKDELVRANSLMETAGSIIRLLAPALSGVLIAAAGVGAAILANSISYFVAALSLCIIRFASPKIESGAQSFKNDFKSGLQFIFRHPVLMPMLIYGAMINLVLAPISVSIPLLIMKVLEGGPALMGLFGSFQSAGVLAASLILTSAPYLIKKSGLVLINSAVALGAVTLVVAFAPHQGWLLIGGALVGFVLVTANMASRNIWQREVPAELRGRAFTARETISSGLRPLGQALAGPAVAVVGPVFMIASAGVLCMVGGLLGFFVPAVHTYPKEQASTLLEVPVSSDD